MSSQNAGNGSSHRHLIHAARASALQLAGVGPNGSSVHPADDSSAIGLPTDFVAGYRITREIRRGGQGIVYQAVQDRTSRRVAIKVMRDGALADDREKSRFDREVQILAQLNHPHIVRVSESGLAAGLSYYVMDYISGHPLDIYMSDAKQSTRQRLDLFARVCDAVNAAHLHGVIHRDLKPSNIRVDTNGEPYILDFGLAKLTAPEPVEGHGSATITGQFVGSLPWASPEQAEGAPGKIDIRTDVYSLGVMLYHALTGRFPYGIAGNLRDVLDNIMRAEPLRPRSMRRDIDDEIETIILKCLAKERERRYQSAGDLARDIRRYLAGEPIEAKRASGWYVLRKTIQKHKLPSALAASLVAAGFVFGAGMTVLYQSAAAAQQQAERKADVAEARAREADQAVEFLKSLVQARDMGEADWRVAFGIGQRLAALSPKTGYEALQRDWQSIPSATARQQLLKAFRFAGHPHTIQILHLGATDPSPKVQSWALSYLQHITGEPFTEGFAGYAAWHARNGQRTLNDILREKYAAAAAALLSSDETQRSKASRGLAEFDMDMRNDPELRKMLQQSGLQNALIACVTQGKSAAIEPSRAWSLLRSLQPDEAFLRQHVVPLLEPSQPNEVRGSATTLLGWSHQRWALAPLRAIFAQLDLTKEADAKLHRSVIDAMAIIGVEPSDVDMMLAHLTAAMRLGRSARDSLWGLAQAIGGIGDARAIPTMIACIDADNTYDTVYGIGYFGLDPLTGVNYTEDHNGKWWRDWWVKNRQRYGMDHVEIPALPAGPRN